MKRNNETHKRTTSNLITYTQKSETWECYGKAGSITLVYI